MKERAQGILAAVAARGGSIAPYADDYAAYVADVAAVKAVVDKQTLPAKAAFVSLLVKAAAAWGLKTFDGPTNGLPRPQLFVVRLLAGLKGAKYDARTVGGYVNNRDVVFEIERRVAAGTMDPKRMPANIQYLIVGAFSKLGLAAKMRVVEAAHLPLTRASLVAASPKPAAPGQCREGVDPIALYGMVTAAFAELGHEFDPAFFASPDFKRACNSYNGVFDDEIFEDEMEKGIHEPNGTSETPGNMQTPQKATPATLETPRAPVKRPRPFADFQVNPWTPLASRDSDDQLAALAVIRRVAEDIGVKYHISFLESPEFRSALAAHHARRLMEVAKAAAA